jgi:hypothetical protein
MLEIVVMPAVKSPEGVLMEPGWGLSKIERTCGDDQISADVVTDIGDRFRHALPWYLLSDGQNIVATANGGTLHLIGSVRSVARSRG